MQPIAPSTPVSGEGSASASRSEAGGSGTREPAAQPSPWRMVAWKLGIWAGLATLACVADWVQLVKDAMADALHSYAVLIPAVSVWLVWPQKRDPVAPKFHRSAVPAVALLVLAAGCLVVARSGWMTADGVAYALGVLGWVVAVWAGVFMILGASWVRSHAFAVGFLLFTVPLPPAVIHAIETGLQHSTAAVIDVVFQLTHVTYSRDAQAFWLPGLRFEVARECSGIRSTLVLFVTSLAGAELLLKSWWRKGLMALVVIGLGIARNAFRICVITLLSVHVDPQIIHSPLHHRGGPIFFTISLVPLFALLWWFRRQERPRPEACGGAIP